MWGMISGMQLFCYVLLFDVHLPEQPTAILVQLIKLATFDIPFANLDDIQDTIGYIGVDYPEGTKDIDLSSFESHQDKDPDQEVVSTEDDECPTS